MPSFAADLISPGPQYTCSATGLGSSFSPSIRSRLGEEIGPSVGGAYTATLNLIVSFGA